MSGLDCTCSLCRKMRARNSRTGALYLPRSIGRSWACRKRSPPPIQARNRQSGSESLSFPGGPAAQCADSDSELEIQVGTSNSGESHPTGVRATADAYGGRYPWGVCPWARVRARPERRKEITTVLHCSSIVALHWTPPGVRAKRASDAADAPGRAPAAADAPGRDSDAPGRGRRTQTLPDAPGRDRTRLTSWARLG